MLQLNFAHPVIVCLFLLSLLFDGCENQSPLSKQTSSDVSPSTQIELQNATTDKHITLPETSQNNQLNPNQINQLNSLKFKSKQGIEINPVVILPNYIPVDFNLDFFEIDNSWKGFYQAADYILVYRNRFNNSCFSIHGFIIPGAGSASSFEMIKNIQSPIGKINIGYTSFDQSKERAQILSRLHYSASSAKATYTYGYRFQSPSVTAINAHSLPICNTISLQEAIKIVQLLQYLHPNDAKNIKINNDVVHTSDPSAP